MMVKVEKYRGEWEALEQQMRLDGMLLEFNGVPKSPHMLVTNGASQSVVYPKWRGGVGEEWLVSCSSAVPSRVSRCVHVCMWA
jgi:hypothetical protein